MKSENRAMRDKFIKKGLKTAKRWGCKGDSAEKTARKLSKTRTLCSCGMCGNPNRKGYKKSQCARRADLIEDARKKDSSEE